MTTVRQLARLAGVSIGTVSKALHDDTRIGTETRARVQMLAELYNYRPNRLMKSLVTGKSRTIGCVMSTITSTVFEAIMTRAVAEYYHVIPFQTHSSPEAACQGIHMLVEQRVEGILFSPALIVPIPQSSILELWSHDIIPVGMGQTLCEVPIDMVTFDEEAIAVQAVDYLMGLGHRRVAYIGPLSQNALSREEAVDSVLRQRGLAADLILRQPSDIDAHHDWYAALFSAPQAPTAIIAFEERIAATALQQAHRHGIRIPEDLSIIGCSNFSIAPCLYPRLTTIDEHWDEIGRKATELLLQRLGEGVNAARTAPLLLKVQPSLVERESCAPPRGRKRLLPKR
ncbi:MAG TPA: LacI family DNA-binding transcriptional regulator [Armatimonadota bacterium]